jgi:hypothetical protein
MRLLVLLSGLTVGFAAQCTMDDWEAMKGYLDSYSVATSDFVQASTRDEAVALVKSSITIPMFSTDGKDCSSCVAAKWGSFYDLYKTGGVCALSPTSYSCTTQVKRAEYREDYCLIPAVERKCTRSEFAALSDIFPDGTAARTGGVLGDAFTASMEAALADAGRLASTQYACYLCLYYRELAEFHAASYDGYDACVTTRVNVATTKCSFTQSMHLSVGIDGVAAMIAGDRADGLVQVLAAANDMLGVSDARTLACFACVESFSLDVFDTAGVDGCAGGIACLTSPMNAVASCLNSATNARG